MTAVYKKEIGFPSSCCLVSFLATSWVGDIVTGSSWCLLGEEAGGLWRGRQVSIRHALSGACPG